MDKRFQTTRQAAATLGVPESYLRREVRNKRVPGFYSGASATPRFYIDTQKFAELLEQRVSAATREESKKE